MHRAHRTFEHATIRPGRDPFSSRLPVVLMALVGASVARGQMRAELDSDRIYLETQTLLRVRVVGRIQTPPTVTPVDGLSIRTYRSPSRSIDIFRGTRTTDFTYLITPHRAGTFTIPAVTVKVRGKTYQKGPFTLEVVKASLRFVRAEFDASTVTVGDVATLSVTYRGTRAGAQLVVPQVDGVQISPPPEPELDITRRTRLPLSTYRLQVRPLRVGVFTIDGISLGGVPAKAVTLRANRFVVVGTQAGENSLVVGGHTQVHVLVKGLPYDRAARLIVPAQVKSVPARRRRYARQRGVTVFSFDVTAVEPGDAIITAMRMPDKTEVSFPEPVVLSVHQSGAGGILACRGLPRKEETVVGEPFIVDFEVLFRGDLQRGLIDLTEAGFAEKDYIKIEPVNDLSYPDWKGVPLVLAIGDGRIKALSGTGTIDGRKEQMLRFALKITPLATGELSLDGLRVALSIQVSESRRTGFSSFFSSRTEQYVRRAEVPPHRVIDPPGVTAPPLYRGAVGKMRFETALDRTTATAMSPMTVTLRITGDGVGSQLEPPPLTAVPELTRDFDVSATVNGGEVKNKTIEFTQVIRPRNESVKELPALPLVYYDYKAKEYETVYSLPIPIEVNPGTLVGASALQLAGNGRSADPTPAQPPVATDSPAAPAVGLGANYTTLGRIVSTQPLGVAPVAGTLVGGPLVVLLAYLGRITWQRRRPVVDVQRKARSVVRSLNGLADSGRFYPDLADKFQEYLRLRLSLPPGELSPNAAATALRERGCSADLQEQIETLLTRCDAERFGATEPDRADRTETIAHARALLRQLDQVIR